jgi:hypothetical protein
MAQGNALHRTTLDYREGVELDDYPVEDWVHNPNMTPVEDVMKRYWKLTGDVLSEMTQGEKETLDAPDMPAHIANCQGMLEDRLDAYTLSRYPRRVMDKLCLLYMQAIAGSLTNRKTHIEQVWTWLWQIEDYLETQKGVIAAKTTIEQVEALNWNLITEFDDDDPQVTVASARAITD